MSDQIHELRARVAQLEAHKAEWRDVALTNRQRWIEAAARADRAETELGELRRAAGIGGAA